MSTQPPVPPGTQPQVTGLARQRARAAHVAAKLATLTVGAVYVGALAGKVRSWRDRHAALPEFSGRTALVAHAYYPELIGEVLACFATFPATADLIVTAPFDRLDEAALELQGVERARLVGVENRGRDIAPFLTLLNARELEAYDAVLKLHTKRSPHLLDGDIRRRLLFTQLAGSRRKTAAALVLFENQATGLVGWHSSWRDSPLLWMTNYQRVAELSTAMAAPLPTHPAFFEGSMFWVRPAALDRLRALALSVDRFEAESGQLDGALHHAVERAFALAATADGYDVRSTNGRLLYARPADSPGLAQAAKAKSSGA